LILVVIFSSFKKWKGNKEYTKQDDKLNLMTFIFAHLQLVIGLVLYFKSNWVQFNENTMSNSLLRFFTVEHIFGMIVAIALITIARIKGKKITEAAKRHKMTFTYYLIALIIMLATIPWPFRSWAEAAGIGWF
jgi:glycopeptide antibiotics resistance protein